MMLVNSKDKIKGSFIAQMPSEWIVKLPSNSVGHTYRMAMYVWHLKGMKKSKDFLVTLQGINSYSLFQIGFFRKHWMSSKNVG